MFAKLDNVVHSLEPGETPSYSVSRRAQTYVQRSQILHHVLKSVIFVK